jgi:PAS domain S-box-containing protein
VSPITLALPAAIAYFVLAFGIVCVRSPWAIGGLLTSDSQGAKLLRKVVPAGFLVLGLIGWLISKPLLTETHFTWVEVSALGILCSSLLAGFIAWIAFIVDRGDTERAKLEEALHISKDQLDRLVDRIDNRSDEPQAEAQLRRKVRAGFAFAIVLTSLLGFLSWRVSQQAAEDAAWVAHTHEVSATLEAVLRSLVDVETGERGFDLTGREAFLEPYEAGKTAVGQDLHTLHLLVSDNIDQDRRLDTLAEQANARMLAAGEAVALRQRTGTRLSDDQLERGKEIMDAARATAAEMEGAENLLLEQRTRSARTAKRFDISVIALGSLVGVIFLSVAGATVSREIGISARARAQVNSLNADLERRVAERTAALGESEGRLAGVIQSATDSIISVDEEQRIVLFNATAERVFRCPAAEALGQPITRFIPQRFHGSHAGHIRKFGDTGVSNRAMGAKGVLWAVRADGNEFQIEASISQVVTGGKKLYTVILRDVTERVQATEARERLAAIVESSDDAIISKTLEGIITAWNHGAEKVFGYSAAEAVGQPMAMLIPPERLNEELEILARIGRRESVEHFETIRMRKDGKRIDVSATISPIRDVNGAVVGSSKVARDICERKRAEQALRESDARRKFALQTAKLGDWELDLITLKAHRSLLHDQIFGYQSPLSEWSFDIFLAHVHPDDRERVRQDFQGRISEGKRWDFECRIIWPNGDTHWIWACGDHQRDSSGQATQMSGIVEDVTGRHQAEEALREKEHMLSESQRIAHVGSWSLDLSEPDGRIIWSEELYRIYGVSPQTFIPTMESLLSLVVPEDRAIMQKWVAACVGGEKPSEFDFRVTLPDGRIRFITGRGELQLDANRRPIRIAGSAQDVTERKLAEGALRESEERFHAMLNGIPQLAWMAEADGSIFWYNQRWYDYTGTTLKQMQGWGWQRVHHPTVLPKVMEEWKASIAHGTEFEMEFPLRAADGHFGTFLTRIVPLKDEEGRVVRWFGTNTDISERKQAEEQLSIVARELALKAEELATSREALEAQTGMLKLVLDNMGEGLIAADQEGRFLVWNNAAHTLMGRGAEDLYTEQWTEHYHVLLPDGITPYPPDRLPLVRALRGESVQVELIVQPPENLQATFLEVTARPLLDRRGSLCGGVAVMRDVTESRENEREIRKLNDELEIRVMQRTAQLEIANHELEAFSYSVSHDLRAPLRHIAGFSKMLVEEFGPTLDPGAKHYLDRIQAGTQRMGLLVDELLGLARVGRHPLNRQPAKLNAIVDDVIALLEPDTQGRHVCWEIADLPIVECDQTLVRQIFQNLLANALKFTRMRDPAVITVGHREQEDGGLVLFVRDNGVGFNMKYADKLFGVFQRLHREEDFEGTGIGLATVQRIVQKHGGRAWAEGEEGKGATFYFTLGVGKAEAKSNGAMAGGQS